MNVSTSFKRVYSTLFMGILFMVMSITSLNAQQKTNAATLNTFLNDRFGMFIHWGPVALRGTEIGWSRNKQVTQEDYDSLYREFNPVLFDADAWVKTAKDAGMRYLTITARHHDGFCLWPTAYTDYNIMHTPYKKDIVGALAEACKKQNIKFCIYYSVLDWYNTDYPIRSSYDQTIDPRSDMNRYIAFMKNQLKELITQYDPYMLWFDGAWENPWTDAMGRDMHAYLMKLKPTLVINNRLGKEMAGVDNSKIDESKMVGDYDTPEQVVGRLNMDTPWESCFTICNQWAWKPNDTMKSLDECLSIASKTFGGNGNLLLNVGPMPDGRIEARQVARLKEIGDWLKKNGQAVYGTRGGPYEPNANFATTRKENKIFIHVIKTNAPFIELKNIPGRKITKAHTMDGAVVTVEKGKETYKVTLPTTHTGKLEYVIVLEMDGNVEKAAVIK